jgi:AdoMet-dependent rRNA methyltransferase SPB1
MTAPEDLDVNDRALQGEDDVFDLGEGEKEMNRRGVSKKALGDVIRDEAAEEDDEEDQAESSESEMEFEDSEEEREYRTQALEGELDELYDQYKDRMNERDAKWKVKQARIKDKNYDAWHGIQQGGSDDSDAEVGSRMVRVPRRGDAEEEDEGEESEEGGWERLAARKAAIGEDDSSESEAEDGESKPEIKKVRTKTVKTERPATAPRALVTSLTDRENRAQMSRQAQLWFDQSVFKGVGDLAALDGDEEEEVKEEEEDEDESMDGDDESDEVDEGEDVDMEAPSLDDADEDTVSDSSLCWILANDQPDDDFDFEIVPRAPEHDGEEWDVEDEDQDEVKRQIVKGESCARGLTVNVHLLTFQTRVS